MGGFAWVTLATNDSYSLGALVLAHSLKQVGSPHQLAVLLTAGVTKSMREKLSSVFDVVQEVNILDSKDETNLRLLKRPELGITFTKLHCWRLTQFDKCVFLDADTLVLKNCDELFEREELSAAPDVGWPDCFNSGVFVYRPSNETYEKLVQFALEKGSFDGGDQGLLNLYFSDWATKDITKHLPFIYNLCSTACYSYLPAFKQFGADTKIIHFIGTSKPWLQYFNTETRKVQPSSDLKHLEGILQHWWNIFCSLVHSQLAPEMARSSSDVTHTSMSFGTSQNHDPQPSPIKNIIWDPWEEYDQNQSIVPLPEVASTRTHFQDIERSSSYQTQSSSNSEPSELKPIQSHNTNAYDASHEHVPSFSYHQPEEVPVHLSYENNKSASNSFQGEDLTSIPLRNPPASIMHSHIPQNPPQDSQQHCELLTCAPEPIAPIPHVQTNESEAAATVCKETTFHSTPCEDQTDSGLAGAFAKLTLGAPRTAEQNALDDHLRRQGWEVGNIDYMGRDSFDNIWSKICQTISSDVSPTSKATEATTPSSTSEPQAEESVPKEALPSPAAATLEDSTPKTSEIIKPQSDHAQSIPSEQPKPVSEVESAVQASEKPQDIKPATLVVSESEIPAVPAAQTEPPQCPIPSKSGQGNASVENIQSPVPPKTEVDPEQPSELPPVVSTTTSEAVPAAALPADSSAALKDAASTTEVSVSAAAPTATASTVAVLTCVIPPKEAQPSTDAAQVESVQVSQEAPQILPTPVEDTKTAPAQVTSLTPAEGPKPLETTPVEVKPSQSPVALPPEQPSTQEVVKPAEAAPAISAPPAELPSPPEQTPTPEISKSIETPPVTSAPPIPEHIPVQEIPKSTEVAPAVPASQVELPSQPVQPPVQEVAKIGTPDTTAPISPAQEVSKTPEPLPAKVEVASPPEAVPLQETAKATTEIAPVIQAETVPATVSSAAEEAASAAPLAEGAAPATSKAKPAVKTKGESAGAGAQPTPPPRKAAGGGKKSKSKK